MSLKNQLSTGDNVQSPNSSEFIHQDRTIESEDKPGDAQRKLQDKQSSFCEKATKPGIQLCGQQEEDQQKSPGQPVDADLFITTEKNEFPDFLLELLRPVPVKQLDAPDSSLPSDSLNDPYESETQEQLPNSGPSGGSVVKRRLSQILDSLFLDLYEEDEEDDISPSLSVLGESDVSADQHPSSSEAADGSTVSKVPLSSAPNG